MRHARDRSWHIATARCIRAIRRPVFARKHDLAARHGVNLEGALTWAFEFEGQPYFAGFRSLATNGIDKPVLNVFRMLAKMDGERLAVESDAAVSLDEMMRTACARSRTCRHLPAATATRSASCSGTITTTTCQGRAPNVELRLANLPAGAGSFKAEHFTVDAEHSNAYTAWQKMGSPQTPTAEQYAELERAGQLAEGDAIAPVAVENGAATVKLTLSRQGVSLVVLDGSDSK